MMPTETPQQANIYLADEQAQLDFAAGLAKQCYPGMVIFLQGDLGTGKTTFVRGFLRGLGYQGIVKSPTYTLVEPYEMGGRRIYHFDLYRLGEPEELEYAGGRDYFDGHSISLIEWPQQAEGYLPAADLQVDLSYAESGRNLTLSAHTEAARKLMLHLHSD